MPTADDTSLSLLARLHDPADSVAWQSFCALYTPLLRRWLVHHGIQEQDADDIQQEVLRIAVVELARFQHSGRTGALRNWLRQTLSHQLTTYWRRKNRRGSGGVGGSEHMALAEQLEDPNSPLSRVWDAEYRRQVCEHLLTRITKEFQEKTMDAFRLVALDDKAADVVAMELGMSANAVRIAQSRVLRRLKEIGQELLD
jgi:RNA polymerase sigma-70 factor, ECF subfamily